MRNDKIFLVVLLTLVNNIVFLAQNPISGNQGFQILSEGNFTTTGGHHIHGPVGIGGNYLINTSAMGSINMDPVGSYIFPGDGSVTTGLLVKGGITWTSGMSTVLSGKYIHIGNSSGSTSGDNGINMNTQVYPTGTGYNNPKRIEGTIDQTPTPAVFQSVGFDFTTLFATYRANSDGMATCANNVQLQTSSGLNISGNNVTSPQDVYINSLINGVNYLDLTTTSLNNITGITFNVKPSATKLIVITVPITANFNWNNTNMAGIGPNEGPFIIWNFSGITTYTITINNSVLIEGTIFAPNHNLIKVGTNDIDGAVIAKTMIIGDGEIHHYPFDGNITLCGSSCSLTFAGKTNEACNNNGTPSVATDDYITFSLNPTGTGLGSGYTVTSSGGAAVTPTTGTYGSATSFHLQNGSANGTTYTITITDNATGACQVTTTVMKPSCSTCPTPDCLDFQVIKN